MSQTVYTQDAPVGFAGMLADSGLTRMVSRAHEEAVAQDFGKPYRAGTDPEVEVLLPSSAGQEIIGVSIHRHNEKARTGGAAKAQPAENLDLLREGTIFVEVEATVVAGGLVAFRFTDNGPLLAGGWSSVDDVETDLLANARWDTGATAGNVAKLVLNLP